MSGAKKSLVGYVASQAAMRMPLLSQDERAHLLCGLKLVLRKPEFEQCEIVDRALTASEVARKQAEEAQLLLDEMFAPAPEAKS